MYDYRCKVLDVVDGDTLEVQIDMGFYVHKRTKIRLAGVNTHETHEVDKDSEEYKKGMKEKSFTASWVDNVRSSHDSEFPFYVLIKKKGKYGRWIALIYPLKQKGGTFKTDGKSLNSKLLNKFNGIAYD